MWPNYNNQFMPQPCMPMQSVPVQQAIQQVQKSAQFYTVDSAQELDGIRPTLNVLYVGFSKTKKEIYVKQLTNDGLVTVETYGLADNKKEKSEFETILEKINIIERKLEDAKSNTNDSKQNVNGSVGPASTDATSQTNVDG